ncbi:hypothetical protein L6164_034943 [Bauhinia variegata]|uniref:Uncharacterized protein n=1 Tax=Bauhinia variegata TaxID=167791 RepID=A0ACB9KWE9_BAUVA|nr:hypothetical protein L6164_034943 [Bauhinia variegata]
MAFQIVQPQNRKKKQSMDTSATDSNAVTTLHTNSSTIDTSISPAHLLRDQLKLLAGVMYDATIPGHRITDEPTKDSISSHHDADLDQPLAISFSHSPVTALSLC